MRVTEGAAALHHLARFSHFTTAARRCHCQERKHGQRNTFLQRSRYFSAEDKQEKKGMQYQAGYAGALLPSTNLKGPGRRQ